MVDIDVERNAVVVGGRDKLWRRELVAENLNFIAIPSLAGPLEVTAMTRYNSPETGARVSPLPQGRALISFAEPVRAPTPGQAVVFYQGDLLLGGGIIKETR